ncbi:hypothetical protein JTE90_004325 [Oedothorax gibbosus]|uniref:Ubiquitin carboxyl-terminal hydrolase n=1 Tax=Oedothorax gibbosus TaxID=931172 RepID=A0AAV6VMV7_9ARAC|nr:hypothetical protein JTE90_004325 [Oedothorax gibbosus]
MSKITWLRLESNPDVLNKFLEHLGVPQQWGISDIISLDDELLSMVPTPVLAVLLLFPISEKYNDYCNEQEEIAKSDNQNIDPSLYYMYQTIKNGCGTVALIHAIANNHEHLKLYPSSVAGKFIEDTKSMSPQDKAEFLEGSNEISAALKDSVSEEVRNAPPSLEDMCPHFIALVQVNGKLYELDGRKTVPVAHGDTNPDSFLKDAARVCKEYMQRDPENLNFTALSFGVVWLLLIQQRHLNWRSLNQGLKGIYGGDRLHWEERKFSLPFLGLTTRNISVDISINLLSSVYPSASSLQIAVVPVGTTSYGDGH